MMHPKAFPWGKAAPLFCLGVFSLLYFPIARLVPPSMLDAFIGRMAWDFLHQTPPMRRWPLTVPPVHGAGEVYIMLPFVLLFGHTAAAIFWRKAVFALLTVAAAYQLAQTVYRDRWTALLASLLLATSPCFVMLSAVGVYAGTALVAFEAACLCLLLSYADQGKPALAYMGFACLGLALSCRSTAAAFLVALLAYFVLYHRELAALLPRRPSERRRFAALCACAALFFLIPVLMALLLHREEILPFWQRHLLVQARGSSNLDYGRNLLFRLRQMRGLLEGTAHQDMFFDGPEIAAVSGQWFLIAALSAALALSVYRGLRRSPSPARWALPWVILAVYFILSPISPTRLKPAHLLPLAPLVFLLSCSLIAMARGTRHRAWLISLFLVFSICRAWEGRRLIRSLQAELERSGGNEPKRSRAAADLVQWFSRRPKSVAVLPAGSELTDAFAYYSGGAIRTVAWEDGPQGLVGQDAHLVVEAGVRVEADRLGPGLSLEETIKGPLGDPVFAIYRPTP